MVKIRHFAMLSLLAFAGPCLCAGGQYAQQSSPTTDQDSATPPAKPANAKQPAKSRQKKPKKVWTNDDIPSVPDPNAPAVDPNSPDAPHPNTTEGPIPKKNVVEAFRRQLTKLRAQLDATDRKINELRNFKADNSAPSGGIDPHHGYTMTPIAEQIQQLEEKRKSIEASIEDVEDQARKAGVEPGQLR